MAVTLMRAKTYDFIVSVNRFFFPAPAIVERWRARGLLALLCARLLTTFKRLIIANVDIFLATVDYGRALMAGTYLFAANNAFFAPDNI